MVSNKGTDLGILILVPVVGFNVQFNDGVHESFDSPVILKNLFHPFVELI
ncbi:MAG: hypothetical protein K2L48_05190 [Mycoplasmoidaceae bacterium]|nr:hypothetical protein [Mycoplasmoidaceae bacterium]